MRRGSRFVLFVLVAVLIGTVAPPARAEVAVLSLDGAGWGHGVGLSQWGAKYAADAGASVEQILATFYPGTELTTAGGAVRVNVLQTPAMQTELQFPQGGEIRSPRSGPQVAGFPVSVAPGGSVVVRFDGSYRVIGGTVAPGPVVAQSASTPVEYRGGAQNGCIPLLGPCTTTPPPTGGGGGGGSCGLLGCVPPPATAPPPTPPTTAPATTVPGTTAPPSSDPATTAPVPGAPPEAVSGDALWAMPAGGGVVTVPARGRSYRGVIHAVGGDSLRLVNELDVETYLKGMGEVPSSWPLAAQAAQAIAARTYVLRAMAISGEVCDYDRCQVYIGAGKESAGQSAAVDATTGRVLTYGGQLATAVYSADAGGFSANTFEGFGTPDGVYPYLTNVDYETPDPLPWHVDVALSDVASRFGYSGTLTGVRISQVGPSGRALEVLLDGTAGSVAIPGRRFSSQLGLRSTLFTGVIGSTSIAPPAPAAGAAFVEQALPDDAAALNAAVVDSAAQNRAGGSTTRIERAAALELAADRPAVGRAVADLADSPAVMIGIAVLGVTTAMAMAWGGGLVAPTGPVPADRIVRPTLAGLAERIGRRRRRGPPDQLPDPPPDNP